MILFTAAIEFGECAKDFNVKGFFIYYYCPPREIEWLRRIVAFVRLQIFYYIPTLMLFLYLLIFLKIRSTKGGLGKSNYKREPFLAELPRLQRVPTGDNCLCQCSQVGDVWAD